MIDLSSQDIMTILEVMDQYDIVYGGSHERSFEPNFWDSFDSAAEKLRNHLNATYYSTPIDKY